jgi:hypothetical protein
MNNADIDWESAPEGATHYCPENDCWTFEGQTNGPCCIPRAEADSGPPAVWDHAIAYEAGQRVLVGGYEAVILGKSNFKTR